MPVAVFISPAPPSVGRYPVSIPPLIFPVLHSITPPTGRFPQSSGDISAGSPSGCRPARLIPLSSYLCLSVSRVLDAPGLPPPPPPPSKTLPPPKSAVSVAGDRSLSSSDRHRRSVRLLILWSRSLYLPRHTKTEAGGLLFSAPLSSSPLLLPSPRSNYHKSRSSRLAPGYRSRVSGSAAAPGLSPPADDRPPPPPAAQRSCFFISSRGVAGGGSAAPVDRYRTAADRNRRPTTAAGPSGE